MNIDDFEEIGREFLKYAPAYAMKEARQAIGKVVDLQKQGVLRDGIYYVVLVDLVGSTKFGVEKGNDELARRIQFFITASFDAFNEAKIRNAGLFLKEIGDAVLFVFQHFPDILRWRYQLDRWLAVYQLNGEPFIVRTCIHIGEVSLHGVNPLSLAISQVFKMEKEVPGAAIVLTEPAYNVAWPTIARAYHAFEFFKDISLDGFKRPVQLYSLLLPTDKDLSVIADEEHD